MIRITSGGIGYKDRLFNVAQLELTAGTLTALIGKNGAGKSTLMKTLCGITPALGGDFFISDYSLPSLSEGQLAKLIAFVSSTQSAIPYLSVTDYVLLGRIPYTGVLGRYQKSDHTAVEEALELFHLTAKKDRGLNELSDGERQLAAFARAFAQSTPVILMDEPTAFLDYGNKRSLLSILKKAVIQLNKCVLISTHDLDLCIEEQIGILGIDSRNHELIHFPQGCSKEEMLREFF